MKVSSIYSKLAGNYLTPGRRSTTTLFRQTQHPVLRRFFQDARNRVGTYSEMRCLVVGPGPEGNSGEIFGIASLIGYYLDEVDPQNVTYLDSSPVVLDLCQRFVTQEVKDLYPRKNIGQFLVGQAETLELHVGSKQYDVIFAALCDHFDQPTFFRSAMNVLKPGGALITSYPVDGINRVIREKIYKIDPRYTRFVVEGKEQLVRSHLMTVHQLVSQYGLHGYIDTRAVDAIDPLGSPSETICQAAALSGMDPKKVPLVVVGLGFKRM